MQKLLRLLVLTTIVLSSYSISWSQNNVTSSIGDEDSLVTVPIKYIKTANAKMVELKYEKEINSKLRTIITNDSIVIDELQYRLATQDNTCKNKVKKVKRQRNILFGTSSGLSILVLLLLL